MRRVLLLLLAVSVSVGATAQRIPEDFKVSGYIQVQNQWGGEAAMLKVGAKNPDLTESFSRFGIRRGRMKFTYETGLATAVFQIDVTEKGVGFKDAYMNLRDPWVGSMALKGGVFDRPFGYEISYSSSTRESPERSTIFQTLFPEERDLGAALVLQAPQTSRWSFLKLEAGLFAGNGIKQETDSKKDFIGHLSATGKRGCVSLGGGVSYYNGSVYQGTPNIWSMDGKKFVLDDKATNAGKFARREYFGIDVQVAVTSAIGVTKLHGEYLFGRQPGQENIMNSTGSPNSSSSPSSATWLRDFNGGYAMLVQGLGKCPVALIVKYDRYDPNTGLTGDDIGIAGTYTGVADIARHTFGFGALWDLDSALRLTAYCDLNRNETSDNLAEAAGDIEDDVFTLRLQYKF